ncbi:hypothetical protein D3C86_1665480 [compost metagenome]
MPSQLKLAPNRPMSARPKICQMVPTTFHGISKGMASTIRHREDQRPLPGMVKAIAIPRGISINSTQPE